MTIDDSTQAMRHYLSRVQLEQTIPEAIWPLLELRYYQPGEYLCHAGERADYFWLIVQGRCKVIPSSEDGKVVVLTYVEPLGLNGDIELFNDCPFLHSVQADEKVVSITIPRHVFFNQMMNNLAFVQLLCKRFANKAYISSKKHSSAMLYSNKERLAHYIIKQVQDIAPQIILPVHGRQACIDFHTSDVAQYLGITARHLRRVLAELEDEGLIKRSGNKVTVTNMQKLEGYAIHF